MVRFDPKKLLIRVLFAFGDRPFRSNNMKEFNVVNFSESVRYTPTAATVQVTFLDEDGTEFTDTVHLSPRWAASLIKAIREPGISRIGLDQCLPSDAKDVHPSDQHFLLDRGSLPYGNWQFWLRNKPAGQ